MEREQPCRGSRRSFEKAPPRLQVIGFDVSAPKDGAGTSPASLLPVTYKPAASSPRSSALQQLLLHQSPRHSPSPSSNQSVPPALPPSASNQSLPPPTSSCQGTNSSSVQRKPHTIKENSNAFSQIKQTGDDEAKEFNNGNDAGLADEISAKQAINELPCIHVAKSQKSTWLHDSVEHPSPGKSRCKLGVQQIVHELPFAAEKNIRSSCRSEEKAKKISVFILAASSPAAESHYHHHYHGTEQYNGSGNMDFLSSCHLCRRHLGQGQDVFMYSGDKAFCSMECRYEQIVMDERKERCPPPIIRSGASQVYQHSSVTATNPHHPIIIDKPHFINTAAAA